MAVNQVHQYPFGYPAGYGNTADDYRLDRWNLREYRLNQVAANAVVNNPAPLGNQSGGMLYTKLLLNGFRGNIGPRFDWLDIETPLSGPYQYGGILPMSAQPQINLPKPWDKFRIGKVRG